MQHHTHTHIYTHTHIHTYVHTYIRIHIEFPINHSTVAVAAVLFFTIYYRNIRTLFISPRNSTEHISFLFLFSFIHGLIFSSIFHMWLLLYHFFSHCNDSISFCYRGDSLVSGSVYQHTSQQSPDSLVIFCSYRLPSQRNVLFLIHQEKNI